MHPTIDQPRVKLVEKLTVEEYDHDPVDREHGATCVADCHPFTARSVYLMDNQEVTDPAIIARVEENIHGHS